MQHAKTMSAVAALAIFAACGWAHSLAAGDAAPSAVQPLLSGGNPDPTVCRVGDEYYIVTSSFSLSPGLPVYRSKDMVNWEVISHAWRESWPCKTPDDGIWAPTLRHHNGVFYLTVTWHDGFKKAENYLLTARDPAGPWSKPMKIDAKSGIDGSLFFDGEDAWYLSNQQPSKQKWRGHCQIWMQRIDLANGHLLGEKHVLTDGFGDAPAFAEGPHLYKIGGKYLLLHAQGGTAWGHMEIALVSDCVTGPYTHVAGNPVLTAKDWGRSSPLQAFGHADLVQMPDGEWRAVFLGMRMADGGAKCLLGRETFSCRVDLDDSGMPTRFRRGELIAGDWNDPAATRYALLDRSGDPVRYVKVRNLAGRVDYPDTPFRFCAALAAVAPRADHIPDECRPKAWWFFGQTETTHEGITADAEAMKRVGFGGVVYYDQYHGENPNAEKLWSDAWWDGLEFAASEAARLGLTFETAVGNGYVAGGPWIDPAHAMKTLVVIDRDTNGGKVTLPLPVAKDRGWQKTVAVLAIPLPEADGKFVDMEYAGHEKGLASTMQHPGGMYGYREKTFKAVTNSLPKIPRWQAKTAAVVDFVPRGDTPVCVDMKDLRDITENFDESDRTLRCELPAGRWKVLRFVAVPTGGRTKHGRPEAMGLECDKMSVAAAELHWKSYTKRIIDRLKSKGIPLAGIILDSHEAGAQNWTDDMLEEFARRRGYDFRPYLPLMAGYCVAPNAEDVLADFRRTCVELIAERYYGTFDRLCREEGLSFTGQAGGGMFMIADSVFSKKYISIPEGEFWGYQKHGAYDVKDTSSAAHLYGKKIASAEAMTDAPYKMTIPELRRRCDLAFAFGANSMTVCAVPHLPKKDCGVKAPTGPREYGLNRSNPWWEGSRPFWDYIAFCSWMLRQGEPAPEALWFAGDDVPVKIIASKVPKALDGLDWDFATGDAAARMTKTADAWTTPEGVRYGYVVDSEGRTLAGAPPARRLNLPHISRLLPSGEKLAFIANDTEHEVKVDLGGESAVVIDPWTRCQTTESSVVIPPGESRFVKGTSAADPVQTCESDVTSRVIRNDSWWNTVDGKPIYSNGGGCYFYEGRWYWYGCRYEEAERVRFDSAFRVDVGGLHTTFVGVTCYSSDDLVNWRDEGIVYAGEGAESEAHGRWFGRVGVAAVPSEGKFVLAMQYMGGVLLAVADSPRGPFVFQEGVDMSASIGYRTTGDQSVFYDDIHGKGYLVFSKPHGRDKTYVAEIGYRNGRAFVGKPTLVFAGRGREGNCMFMHRGKYYLCASDLYGWDGSRAYWMVSDSPTGPYRRSQDGDMFLMRNAVEDYCRVSQTGFFVTVRGTEQETVVFCGDRWTQFADNGIGFNVWTPLSFDGDEPVFTSLSEWSLDAATGKWAVASGNNYVRNGSFDADRRQIPIRHKPDQDFVSGWTVEPVGGFLNATNKTCDKAFVTGKFALSLSAPFPRRAYQKIEDIPNGNYMLRYWRDDGKGWQRHEESVCVTNGTHVVEFVATAPCRIDDVSLVATREGAVPCGAFWYNVGR